MNRLDAEELFTGIKVETGVKVEMVKEHDVELWAGKRLAGEPYRILIRQNGTGQEVGIMIKFRDRTPRMVARYIYQAIAEILWPTIPYWKQRWYGLVMAQPNDLPKGVKVPAGAQGRTRLLALTIAQAKRKN